MIDAKLMNWLRRLANERNLGDDAVQEAAIAIWHTLQKRPDAPNSYLVGVAKRQMTSVACGRAMTGHASMRGKRDSMRNVATLEGLEEVLRASDEYGEVEVRMAVESLSAGDQAIVRGHFYEGRAFSKPGWERWNRYIKPELRKALEVAA